MAVCGNRTDTPGFFTPCYTALGCKTCECARQVQVELLGSTSARACCDTMTNRPHQPGCTGVVRA